MAGRALVVNVTVGSETYMAGTTPPQEIAEQITNPKAWGETTTKADESETPETPELFDPSAEGVGVDEVNNHLAEADDDEVARVLAAEAAGKNRKGIVEGPYAPEKQD